MEGRTDAQTEERALAHGIHYEKAINCPRRVFFFLHFFSLFVCVSVSFKKKITVTLPLTQQRNGLYSTTRGGAGRGGAKDFINKRQVPDLQFVNMS